MRYDTHSHESYLPELPEAAWPSIGLEEAIQRQVTPEFMRINSSTSVYAMLCPCHVPPAKPAGM
jgi:hypothetical protein